MSERTPKKTTQPAKEKEIVFICKFCGETKPLSEMVVMRHYYPPVSACKECAKAVRNYRR